MSRRWKCGCVFSVSVVEIKVGTENFSPAAVRSSNTVRSTNTVKENLYFINELINDQQLSCITPDVCWRRVCYRLSSNIYNMWGYEEYEDYFLKLGDVKCKVQCFVFRISFLLLTNFFYSKVKYVYMRNTQILQRVHDVNFILLCLHLLCVVYYFKFFSIFHLKTRLFLCSTQKIWKLKYSQPLFHFKY